MKVRLIRFYQEKVQPRIEALKARAAQLKQQVTAWLARRKRSLRLAAAIAITLIAVALLAILWRRSPAFRSAIQELGAAVAGLWVLFKGRPGEIPVPVVVTEQLPVEEPLLVASDPEGWL